MIARSNRDEIALAGIIFVLARAFAEVELRLKNEVLVVERIHDQRQVGGADDERALATAAVEVTMLGVERDCKEALRPPLEALLAAIAEFELRAPASLENVDHLLVEVALRGGRTPGRDVEQKHIGEVAATLEMHRRRPDVVAWPRRGLNLEKVDAVILGDGKPLLFRPLEIGIDPVSRFALCRHAVSSTFLYRSPAQENSRDLTTTGTTPGGVSNCPTSTKSSSCSCTPSIDTIGPGQFISRCSNRPNVLPMSPSIRRIRSSSR